METLANKEHFSRWILKEGESSVHVVGEGYVGGKVELSTLTGLGKSPEAGQGGIKSWNLKQNISKDTG